MGIKGRHIVIGTCHLLKPIKELEVEDLRVHREEVLRGEPQVEGDRGEVSRRKARHPSPEYRVGTVGNLTIPRIIVGERLKSA